MKAINISNTMTVLHMVAVLVVLLFALGAEVSDKFPYIRFTQWKEFLCIFGILFCFSMYMYIHDKKLVKRTIRDTIEYLDKDISEIVSKQQPK